MFYLPGGRSVTVIGNGLLSREFNKNAISDECVIIAAGVSNSKETKAEEFNREELLVKDIFLRNIACMLLRNILIK